MTILILAVCIFVHFNFKLMRKLYCSFQVERTNIIYKSLLWLDWLDDDHSNNDVSWRLCWFDFI